MHSAQPFFLLALALGIAATLIALFSKMAGLTRTPRLSDHPDDAWRGYSTGRHRANEAVIHEEDAPFLAPQESQGPADLDAHEWIEQSPPAQADPAARPQDREPAQSEQVGPTLKDIELALRVVQQARQSITRT
jgi:hypothetical protein